MTSEAGHVPVEGQFDFLYSRTETSFGPAMTISGMSWQVQTDIHFIGLNADGRCTLSVLYGATGSLVPQKEGTYRVTGDEVGLAWSNGTKETGQLSADHEELTVGGATFKAGANKL